MSEKVIVDQTVEDMGLLPFKDAINFSEEEIAKREKVNPLLAAVYQMFLCQLQDHVILQEAKVRGLV